MRAVSLIADSSTDQGGGRRREGSTTNDRTDARPFGDIKNAML
jgi:hypothetical protein